MYSFNQHRTWSNFSCSSSQVKEMERTQKGEKKQLLTLTISVSTLVSKSSFSDCNSAYRTCEKARSGFNIIFHPSQCRIAFRLAASALQIAVSIVGCIAHCLWGMVSRFYLWPSRRTLVQRKGDKIWVIAPIGKDLGRINRRDKILCF